MKLDLENKNILVTGATGGIGRQIVNSLIAEGANLLITGSNKEKLISFKEEHNNVSYVVCNLAKIENINNLVLEVKKIFNNKVDVLINNAGITRDNLTIRMKDEEWNDVININLSSVFFLTKEILKIMLRERSGNIINISSIIGTTGNLGQANYAASKSGLEAMSRSVALEVAKRGINVNCIAPGFIETKMTKELLEKNKEIILKNIPCNRIGLPKDVASIVCFLSSKLSNYITGQTFHVNGGMYM